MLQHPEERRQSRSDNLYKALELQLASTAQRARFSSVILTEAQGVTVASTGDAGELEEIAALSPQLAPGGKFWQGRIKSEDGSSRLFTVAPIVTESGKLYLCAVGGTGSLITTSLLMGGRGVDRILAYLSTKTTLKTLSKASAMARRARGIDGETRFWPLTRNLHVDGILALSLAGGFDDALQAAAQDIMRRLLEVAFGDLQVMLDRDGDAVADPRRNRRIVGYRARLGQVSYGGAVLVHDHLGTVVGRDHVGPHPWSQRRCAGNQRRRAAAERS